MCYYWKVTRSLVSYDLSPYQHQKIPELKGHQIIGELRLPETKKRKLVKIERSPDHWWVTTLSVKDAYWAEDWKVTRSLVSYDLLLNSLTQCVSLKGHQIIGELRLKADFSRVSNGNWKVTRSLVSYDVLRVRMIVFIVLKGHQIIGELRPILTTSFLASALIERSPDHWWVTTNEIVWLNGENNWKVTRSLVSYDRINKAVNAFIIDWKVTRSLVSYDLKYWMIV